jgi:hypothetical protein
MRARQVGQHGGGAMSVPAGGSASGPGNVETGAGTVPQVETEAPVQTQPALSVDQLIGRLREIRLLVLPMFEQIIEQYQGRVRGGFPTTVDNIERGGVIGISLDPGWGVYFMTDGSSVYAEIHNIDPRWDALSAANAEKFAGHPRFERRELDDNWSAAQYRNLIGELLSRWNYQQLRIYRVDS